MGRLNLSGKRVLVTGGKGFLGKHLLPRLAAAGAEVYAPSRTECDFTDSPAVASLFAKLCPEIVIHAAGFLGGIHFSRVYPADVFLNNLRMTCNILEVSARHAVTKLVNIGSACVYSDALEGPFRESDMFSKPMHPSVQYYGFSKQALVIGAEAMRRQYGLRSIHLVLANLYGPGDKFDPELSHVVSSLIPKFYRAARERWPEVVCWGSGQTVREFLYVEDCAEAVVRAAQCYEEETPLNIGVGEGMTIQKLAEWIQEATGFKGKIRWDTSIPDGARYKVVDTSRMKHFLGWEAPTPFPEGLKKTLQWFGDHYSEWRQRHGAHL